MQSSTNIKVQYLQSEIDALHRLIDRRKSASPAEQKKIRQIMRKKYGFWGWKHWGITNLDHYHLDNLIASGKIQVVKSVSEFKNNITGMPAKARLSTTNLELKEALTQFKKLIPSVDNMSILPSDAGNYIICLKSESELPKTNPLPQYTSFQGLRVIYTGLSTDLNGRDYQQHFLEDDASWSTLRKSLGVLFKYKLVPRVSKRDPSKVSDKTKFSAFDEANLSLWMKKNLVLFYMDNKDFENLECKLIDYFDPPLNLSKVDKNSKNADFRSLLTKLRNPKDLVKV